MMQALEKLKNAKKKASKALKIGALGLGLALSPLALKAQDTEAFGFAYDDQTFEGIEHVDLEAIMQSDITKGFSTTTDATGYWYMNNIPIITGIHDQKAPQEENTLDVSYEQGQLRFRAKTKQVLKDMNIIDMSGKTVGSVRFEPIGLNTFEAVWSKADDAPEGVLLIGNNKLAAKFYTGDLADHMRHQQTPFNSFTGPARKGAQAQQADPTETAYLLKFRHAEYLPLDTIVSLIHNDVNRIDVEMTKGQAQDVLYHTLLRAQNDGNNLDSLNVKLYNAITSELLEEENTRNNTLAMIDTYAPDGGLEGRFDVQRPGYEEGTQTRTLQSGVENNVIIQLLKNLYEGNIVVQENDGTPLDSANIYFTNRATGDVLLQADLGDESQRAFSQRIALELLNYRLQASRQGYDSNAIEGQWTPGNNGNIVIRLDETTGQVYYFVKQATGTDQDNGNAPITGLELTIRELDNSFVDADNSGSGTLAETNWTETSSASVDKRVFLDANGYEELDAGIETIHHGENNRDNYSLRQNRFYGEIRVQNNQGTGLQGAQVELIDRDNGQTFVNENTDGDNDVDYDNRLPREPLNLRARANFTGYDEEVTDVTWNPGERNLTLVLQETAPNEYDFRKQATATDQDNGNAPITGLELTIRELDNSFVDADNSGSGTLAQANWTETSTDDTQKRVILDANGYEQQEAVETIRYGQDNRDNYSLRQNLFEGSFRGTDEGASLDSIFVNVRKVGESSYLFQITPTGATTRNFSEREAEEGSFQVEIDLGRNGFYTENFTDTWEVGSNNNVVRDLDPIPPDNYEYETQVQGTVSGTPQSGLELIVRDPNNSNTVLAQVSSGGGTTAIATFLDTQADNKVVDLELDKVGYEEQTNRETLTQGSTNPFSYVLVPNRFNGTITGRDAQSNPINGLDVIIEDRDDSQTFASGYVSDNTFEYDDRKAREPLRAFISADGVGYELTSTTRDWNPGANNVTITLPANRFYGAILVQDDQGAGLQGAYVELINRDNSQTFASGTTDADNDLDYDNRIPEEPLNVRARASLAGYTDDEVDAVWDPGQRNLTLTLDPETPVEYDYETRVQGTDGGTPQSGLELIVRDPNNGNAVLATVNSGGSTTAIATFTDLQADNKVVDLVLDKIGYEEQTNRETLDQASTNPKTYALARNRFYGEIRVQDGEGAGLQGALVELIDRDNSQTFASGNTDGDNDLDYDNRLAREPLRVRARANLTGYNEDIVDATWDPGQRNLTLTLDEIVQAQANFRGAINATGVGYVAGQMRVIGQDVTYDETGVTTTSVPYHDFANIPIDPNDGESELEVTLTQTTFPFETSVQTLLVTQGDNGFQQFNVTPIVTVDGKRLQGYIELGQTGGSRASGYRVIVRDNGGSVVSDEVIGSQQYLTPKLEEGFNGTISVFYSSNSQGYYGIMRAPISIGNVNSPSDTLQNLNMRFTPIDMRDPQTGGYVTTNKAWITDMEGGSYNRSYWDNRIEDVYLSPEVNVTNYDALLQSIEDYFGITLNENRVSSPITGTDYGLNIYDDPNTGAVTYLRYMGDGHIGANIELSGLLREDIKERMGRWYEFTDVNTRSNSFMNPDASLPSIEDRAIVYDYFDHQDAIEDGDATYSYYYIQKPNDGGF